MNADDLEKLGIEKRMVALNNRVDFEIVHNICQRLVIMNAIDSTAEITLFINSSGGKVEAGWELYDTIRGIRAPVRGIVVGIAESMALDILQACDIREACPHATMLMHPINFDASLPRMDSKKFRREKEEITSRLVEAYIERAKVGEKKVRKLMAKESKLTAIQALKLGFIDRITEPGSI